MTGRLLVINHPPTTVAGVRIKKHHLLRDGLSLDKPSCGIGQEKNGPGRILFAKDLVWSQVASFLGLECENATGSSEAEMSDLVQLESSTDPKHQSEDCHPIKRESNSRTNSHSDRTVRLHTDIDPTANLTEKKNIASQIVQERDVAETRRSLSSSRVRHGTPLVGDS